jgi:hypothetical protein
MRSRRHRHSMRKATPPNGSGTGWVGPYQISSLLGDADARPPEAPGLYIVSERPWSGMPNLNAGLIYVGRAAYIRYRMGQLLCEMCGFTSETTEDEAYGHRGGHAIWHRYCLPRNVEPLSLYIAWCSDCRCLDCAEMKLAPMLTVRLDVMPIHPCSRHRPPLDLAENCSHRGTLNL